MNLGAIVLPLLLAGPAAETRLMTPGDVFTLKTVADPRVSPDGRYVAYTVASMDATDDESNTDVYMSPRDGGAPVKIASSKKDETDPRWSPDGKYLAFLATRDDDEADQVYLLDRRGGEGTRLTSFRGGVSAIVWSPDGKRLALVVKDAPPERPKDDKKPRPIVTRRRQFKDDENGDDNGYLTDRRSHIQVVEVEGGKALALTSGPFDDSEPAWSPDGRHVAFVSNRTSEPDGNFDTDVFVVRSDKAEWPRLVTASPTADTTPAWSPDGQWIAYVQGGAPKDIWYAPTNLAVVPFAGGPGRVLTPSLDRNVTTPRFSPDGKTVFFLLEDRGNVHLARVPAAGGAVERVVAGERVVESYDVSPEGEVFVLETSAHQPSEVSVVAADGLRRVTTINDAVLKSRRLAPVERRQAKSPDGTEVEYFVVRPADAPAGQKLQTMLHIHGGPALQFTTGFHHEWQTYAGHGYQIVGANPRGSTGRGHAYSRAIWADWGNKDRIDLMAALDDAVARGGVDPERLVVGGHSYGGMMTNYVIARTTRFKAAFALSGGGFYLGNFGPDQYQRHYEYEVGLPWKATAAYLKLSYPFLEVERITTPALYAGGDLDQNVPLMNTEQMYQALKSAHKEAELVVYPGEHHDLARPSFLKDYYERVLAWCDRWVTKERATDKP